MGYLDHPSLVDYSCFLHSACIAIRKTCRDYAADGVERPCWGQGRHGSPHTMVDSGSKTTVCKLVARGLMGWVSDFLQLRVRETGPCEGKTEN